MHLVSPNPAVVTERKKTKKSKKEDKPIMSSKKYTNPRQISSKTDKRKEN